MLVHREIKTPILLGFMALNFALLGVDVLIAHSQNSFFRFEIIPLIFAPLAVLATLTRLCLPRASLVRQVFNTTMWLGVAIGIAGTFFHLAGNATSNQQSLFSLLVTGSPVAAPIAFAGVSLFSLAAASAREKTRTAYLLQLTGLGFLGAALAAFLDHARLGFTPIYTIIPLATGIFAALTCFWQGKFPGNQDQNTIFFAAMGLNILTGLIGFGLHVAGDLAGTKSIVLNRFMYRAPVLGPLLFCNLAVLGVLSALPDHLEQNLLGQSTRLVRSQPKNCDAAR